MDDDETSRPTTIPTCRLKEDSEKRWSGPQLYISKRQGSFMRLWFALDDTSSPQPPKRSVPRC